MPAKSLFSAFTGRSVRFKLLLWILAGGLSLAQDSKPGSADQGQEDKAAPREAPAEMTGLEIGERAPSVQLPNQLGEIVSLQQMLKNGPVAIVFHRSADW